MVVVESTIVARPGHVHGSRHGTSVRVVVVGFWTALPVVDNVSNWLNFVDWCAHCTTGLGGTALARTGMGFGTV